jgi:hypothetical protein
LTELFFPGVTNNGPQQFFNGACDITSLNRYEYKLNTISKLEDKSKKLIIGTNVFNALVASSKRLDSKTIPEVGPSTYKFHSTRQTRLFISSKMILKANKTIENAQSSDFKAQFRQVRSSFTNPQTYTFSRFFSEWAGQLLYRSYTVFTGKVKSSKSELLDFMIASKVLAEIANAMVLKNVTLEKTCIESLCTKNSNTEATKAIEFIFKLFGENDDLNIVGNEDLEAITMELSAIVTNNLKKENESIINEIRDFMDRYADIYNKK